MILLITLAIVFISTKPLMSCLKNHEHYKLTIIYLGTPKYELR